MVSVNGNYKNKGNYYFAKEVAKKDFVEEKVEKTKEEGKTAEFKELGDELLSAEMFTAQVNMFTVNEKLDKETADDLRELFEMAGISHRLPTAVEYARIANNTKAAVEKIAPFETERNVEMLFANSTLMNILEEETQF